MLLWLPGNLQHLVLPGFTLQSNKIIAKMRCKFTGFLGNFHGLILQLTIQPKKINLIFNDLQTTQNGSFVRPSSATCSVLQRRHSGLAFKEFGKITLVGKIQLPRNFCNTQTRVYQQALYFQNLLCFNDF